MPRITARRFKEATGVDPEHDDLKRCNCQQSDNLMHMFCGWDYQRNLPNFWPKLSPERIKEVFDEMRKRKQDQ